MLEYRIESPHKIKAGVIEWPFEFELSPSMPESVEGLPNTYVIYNLHASVSRPGWNTKDLQSQERIRIVRTLGQASMETTRSRVNADVWANKISYSISIPTDAVVFGTSITADVELSPLKKGLTMGRVDLRLVESTVKRIHLSELPDSRDRTRTDEIEVAREEIEFPEDSKVTYEDGTAENPTMGDEMYRFKATLPLPTSLNECRPDVDSHPINITHRFKLLVNLHNPEGHVSQLVCRLPVKVFISPNLPLDESNQVCRPANGPTDEDLNNTEMSVSAPPQYGRHQLDELYSDIDRSGYASRAPSSSGSPSGLDAQSRSHSLEDLDGANGTVNGQLDDGDAESDRDGLPAMLQRRLANLEEGRRSDGDYPIVDSEPMSRQHSGEGDSTGVRRRDYDMSNLTKVPSYGHALRSSGNVTPYRDGPPTYMEATSRPSSPPGIQHHVEDDADGRSRSQRVRMET